MTNISTVAMINVLPISATGSIAVPKPSLAGQVNPGTLGSMSGSVAVPKPGFIASGQVVNPPQVFPLQPLVIFVELFVGGTWIDITDFVYQRDAITIGRGRPNEASTISPGALGLTINNRDGRFSPRNPAGPYFGDLGRNNQLRLSAPTDPLMSTLDYRFWGEVPAWPPQWDTTGQDVFTQITVAGIIRRLTQSGAATLGTALTRYYQNLTGAAAPAGFWPADDGTSATRLASAVQGVQPMTISGVPTLSNASPFPGSAAIPVLNGSSWNGVIGAGAPAAKLNTVIFPSGSGSGVIPPGVFSLTVEGWSPGGPGAGGVGTAVESTPHPGGFGGGGGGYGKTVIPVEPGLPYTWQVGTGGVGGTSNHLGTLGTQTKFTYNGVTKLLVTPGGVPSRSAGGSGGGGSGSVGQVLRLGGKGGTDTGSGAASGGGSAGPSSAGPAGRNAATPGGSVGATPVAGGGKGGTGGSTGGHGGNGSGPGGGGGGGGGLGFNVNGGGTGGNGAGGKLQMTYSASSVGVVSANTLRFLLDVPAAGDTNLGVLARMFTTGSIYQLDVIYGTGGTLTLTGYSAAGAVIFTSGAEQFHVNGVPLIVTAELQQNGTSITWVLGVVPPGQDSTELLFSGSVAGVGVSTVTQVIVNPGGLLRTTSLGAPAVQYITTDISEMAFAAAAYEGEQAADRFQRLCSEEGVDTEVTGSNEDTALMGAQQPGTLMSLLQECENADLGQLYEPRRMFGLGYRTRVDMCNQTPVCALDYAQSQLVAPLAPTDDDQLLANSITVTRTGGSSFTASTQTGRLSVNPPPAGVGPYPKTYTVNVASDEQLPGVAGWLRSIGSVDQPRFPQINVNLARNAEIGAVFGPITSLDVGDLLTISHPPPWLPPELIQQLAVGWTETLGIYTWTIGWNAVPALPYFTAVSDNGAYYGKADTDGSQLDVGIGPSDTTMQVATTDPGFPLWTVAASDFPFDVIMNGERITVHGITGLTSPQTFQITRSINGVVLSHNAGEAVSLFYPATTGI